MENEACIDQIRARLYEAIDNSESAQTIRDLSTTLDDLLVKAIRQENPIFTQETDGAD